MSEHKEVERRLIVITPEHILIFDGDCAFCTSCVRWLQHHWRASAAATAIDYQSILRDGAPFPTPTPEEMQRAVWWLDASGRAEGARAVSRALLATTGVWRFAGWLMGVPPLWWAAPWVYRHVAAHRHRLPGAGPACRLPDAR